MRLPERYDADRLPGPWDGGPPRLWLAGPFPAGPAPTADRALLDADELARAAAFVRPGDRAAYIRAHALVRRLLGGCLGVHPARVSLVREACPCCGDGHGRPAVAGSPLHYSLSRGAGVVLVGIAASPIGVDIEKIPAPDTAQTVLTALHPEERAELLAVPPAARPAAFARCWARKEAYLKGTGTGLAEHPSRTYVGAGAIPARLPRWTLTDVRAPLGYRAACAVQSADGAD
ncbi:4'-phosphopantetheinyl transferase family protein [Streptomyces sp. NPDC048696]|uniref:4'-phosphopantetheinyl transferase family protein n=1 Tax=Streptomyces sp. NPDC048696 TaxID=3365585 RepID=UPI0037214A82